MKQDIKINEHHNTELDLIDAISDTSKATAQLAMQNSEKIIQLSKLVSVLTTCLIGALIIASSTLIITFIL